MTTPTPDQPRPDAAEMPTARDVFNHAVCHFDFLLAIDALAFTDAVWDMMAEAGFVIVERDDLELAVEWMDQSDNPWSGEAFQETWVDSLLMRDRLKDALASPYAARQGDDSDDR